MTSWTEENPGRRFYGCGLYKVRNNVGRGLCYGLFVDYFWLFWAYRLQVGNGVIILSGTIQLPTFVRRKSWWH